MPPVYSHSRLACFEKCPKQFHYRYVLKIPSDTESIEAFVGKRVHEVLERLHVFVDQGMVPSLRKVFERFRTLWDEQYDAERVRIVREGTGVDDYLELGERCLENHYRRHYPFDAGETLGLEQHVSVVLDSEGTYRVRGIIDRLVRMPDGSIEIHDYKTGRRMLSQKDLDSDRQLALYQLAVREQFGERHPVVLVWHYLFHGATRTSTRTPEQLAALREEIIAGIRAAESETEYEARPSALCGWCEYRDRCPEGRAREESFGRRLPPPPPPTPDPAGQLDLL